MRLLVKLKKSLHIKYGIRVSENVCKESEIFFYRVKAAGEQMPQVVWKDLRFVYAGLFTDGFHFMADIAPVQWFSGSCLKDRFTLNALIVYVGPQFLFQLLWQQNGSILSFQVNLYPAAFQRLYRDEFQFSDPDPGTADCQNHIVKPKIRAVPCCHQQTSVLLLEEFSFFIDKCLSLNLQELYRAGLTACKFQIGIYRRELRVYGLWLVGSNQPLRYSRIFCFETFAPPRKVDKI